MVDTALEQVFVENQPVSLSRTEFAVVDALIRHPRGQAMSQEELVTRVWGGPPTSNIVEVYIGYLRRKLGAERIRTVRGRGTCSRVAPPCGGADLSLSRGEHVGLRVGPRRAQHEASGSAAGDVGRPPGARARHRAQDVRERVGGPPGRRAGS